MKNECLFPSPRLGLYEKALPDNLSWEDKLRVIRDLGFDYLEISIDESDKRLSRLEWSDTKIQQLKELTLEYEVPIHSMCLSAHRRFPYGSHSQEVRNMAEIIMSKAISLAVKLGVRVIQLAGYDVFYENHDQETHKHFISGMKSAAKLAERAGVMLGVEIMDTPYLNSIGKFLILKREIPSPYFMVYPDVGNLTGWLKDVPTELALGRDVMVGLHLKDSKKVSEHSPGQFRDLVIGDGDVDFSQIFKTLNEINYSAPYVIEMWAQDEHWKDNILIAKSRIMSFMENARLAS
ncbi:L-ribulose-5-phosphate 3-epimerase [Vibrio sp.]|nr:L-ribulose-5-phosphate 3-epimerase [Vibrio sp.]